MKNVIALVFALSSLGTAIGSSTANAAEKKEVFKACACSDKRSFPMSRDCTHAQVINQKACVTISENAFEQIKNTLKRDECVLSSHVVCINSYR